MATAKYTDIILETIDQLRKRKARPDLERICHMVERKHGISFEETEADLERLVEGEVVIKVDYKGSTSYRNAAKWKKTNQGGNGSGSNDHTRKVVAAVKALTKPNKSEKGSSESGPSASDGQTSSEQGASLAQLEKHLTDRGHEIKSIQAILDKEVEAGRLQLLENGNYKHIPKKPVEKPEKSGSESDSKTPTKTPKKEKEKHHEKNEKDASDIKEPTPKKKPAKRKKIKKTHGELDFTDGSNLGEKTDEGDTPPPAKEKKKSKSDSSSGGSKDTSITGTVSSTSAPAGTPAQPKPSKSSSSKDGSSKSSGSKSSSKSSGGGKSSSSSAATAGSMSAGVVGGGAGVTSGAPSPTPSHAGLGPVHAEGRMLGMMLVDASLAKCDYCLLTSSCNRNGLQEDLLICKDCQAKAHPSCMEYSEDLARRARNSPWQCIDCKTCYICTDAGDPDKMLFCDACDKGYHMDCHNPPIEEKPTGKWVCQRCVIELGIPEEELMETEDGQREKGASTSNDQDGDGASCLPTPSESPVHFTDSREHLHHHGHREIHRPIERPRENGFLAAVKMNGNGPRYPVLPRLADTLTADVPDASEWTIEDVVAYFKNMGFIEQCEVFREQEIDGKSLLLMKRSDVLTGLSLKLGPALKIFTHIQRLQTRGQMLH